MLLAALLGCPVLACDGKRTGPLASSEPEIPWRTCGSGRRFPGTASYPFFCAPEAENAHLDTPMSADRSVDRIVSSAGYLLLSNRWTWMHTDDQSWADALGAQENELLARRSEVESAPAEVHPQFMATLLVALDEPWSRVDDVLTLLTSDRLHVRTIHFPVSKPGNLLRHRFEWRILPPGSRSGAPGSSVALRARHTEDDDRFSVSIQYDSTALEFPEQSAGYLSGWGWGFSDDAAWYWQADQKWASLEEMLARQPPGEAVHLDLSDTGSETPFAYVVKVLDLLVGSGVRRVHVLPGDLVVGLEMPPDQTALYEFWTAPEPTPWLGIVVASVLGVVVVFVLTLLPLRSRRRRRGEVRRYRRA